ncbi:hypothetical protein Tco_1113514 [Tanacetum coccineum]|uniref:Uncharacterized protein n=1 Tax=Tanacetum coccineum TaxID=301880 RepID=A0ABQ5ISD4_9ASTR
MDNQHSSSVKHAPTEYSILTSSLVNCRLSFFQIDNIVDARLAKKSSKADAMELLHKNFRDISRNGECLEACIILDHINNNLKGFFFLLYCGFSVKPFGCAYVLTLSAVGTHSSSRAMDLFLSLEDSNDSA